MMFLRQPSAVCTLFRLVRRDALFVREAAEADTGLRRRLEFVADTEFPCASGIALTWFAALRRDAVLFLAAGFLFVVDFVTRFLLAVLRDAALFTGFLFAVVVRFAGLRAVLFLADVLLRAVDLLDAARLTVERFLAVALFFVRRLLADVDALRFWSLNMACLLFIKLKQLPNRLSANPPRDFSEKIKIFSLEIERIVQVLENQKIII
jgi:hypothetical protein